MDVTTAQVNGIPLTRRWLIPQESRPKYFGLHPTMSADEVRQRTQAVWDKFYSFDSIWRRSSFLKSLKARCRISSDFENLSADVRRHRNHH